MTDMKLPATALVGRMLAKSVTMIPTGNFLHQPKSNGLT